MREGGRDGGSVEGGKEGGSEGGREGGREAVREGGREGSSNSQSPRGRKTIKIKTYNFLKYFNIFYYIFGRKLLWQTLFL